jgi:sugar lactone lactonase YvrE
MAHASRSTLSAPFSSGFALVATLLASACGSSPPPPPEPAQSPPPPAPAVTAPPPAPTPAATAAAPPAETKPPAPSGPAPAVKFTGFATPESVLYDEASDRYLVSNINGGPSDVDGNGYISVLSPDGKVTAEKWIAGGVNKAKLDAPKGMTISQGVLYVADITTVRKFDLKTGAPKGDVPIAGTTFLNDVSAAPDGKIYVTDSGVKATANGFEPTGTDAVYVIDKGGKVKPVAKSKELGGPNGVLANDKGALVVSMNGEIYRLDKDGKKADVTKTPEGGLDGVVMAGDSLLVSSWKGSAVYKGKLGGTFEPVVTNVSGPADIGFDRKRGRVLVPRFMDNAVEAYEIK